MKGRKTTWPVRVMACGVGVLATIGVVMVVRRALMLGGVIEPYVHLQFGAFDGAFAQHPVLTFAHILPGALFLILAPLQFVPSLRARHPWLHRWLGRVLVVLGVIIGITALLMSAQMTIGGANETVATVVFALVFLFALGNAVYHIQQRDVARHREWMIRMVAIGLAIATVRPLVGMFFAFTRLSPHEFFGIAFWLGSTIHVLAAEVGINYTRPQAQLVAPKPAT